METKEIASLDSLATALQRRWGTHALYRLPSVPEIKLSCIATGFPELDAGLQTGGIPRGQISEFLGQPTSGRTTLALKLVGNAQAEGDSAAYIDLGDTFDPAYAAGCGVDLDRLLLVRPEWAIQALDVARDLVIDGNFGLLVLDFAATQTSILDRTNIRTLVPLLSHSNSAALFLAQSSVTSLAALRIEFAALRWLYDTGTFVGFTAGSASSRTSSHRPNRRWTWKSLSGRVRVWGLSCHRQEYRIMEGAVYNMQSGPAMHDA